MQRSRQTAQQLSPSLVAYEQQAEGVMCVRISGVWDLHAGIPSINDFRDALQMDSPVSRLIFDTTALAEWETGLVSYLSKIIREAEQDDIAVDQSGLPEGVQSLLALAFAVPEKQTGKHKSSPSLLTQIGLISIDILRGAPAMLDFLGEVTLAFLKMLVGKARYRKRDLGLLIQDAGPQAVPIVSLISFLVGIIVAYMGAVQLRQFGAQIYVADLVALGMVREMAPIMTGIIMAGRTGASYAAQLGTMQVNEEIDAYRTMGFSPIEFLVLPRMLALVMMVPLLTVYADLVGILAGLFVGVAMLDLGLVEYYNRTVSALTLLDVVGGLVKAAIYGVLIAAASCLRGIESGRSASAVGEATTSAVVTSIVFIVMAAGLLTVIYQALGI